MGLVVGGSINLDNAVESWRYIEQFHHGDQLLQTWRQLLRIYWNKYSLKDLSRAYLVVKFRTYHGCDSKIVQWFVRLLRCVNMTNSSVLRLDIN